MSRIALTHVLPGPLPEGERVLWQGAPEWRGLARDALHLRGLALYCAALVASLAVSRALHGAGVGQIAFDTTLAALVAAVPLLVGVGYAYVAARCATYVITNRRVVIRMGVALTMTVNLPFARIDSAGLRTRPDGTGEIRLMPLRGERVAALVLWPHANLWRGAPVLRALRDAERAGQVLARAMAAHADAPMPSTVPNAVSLAQPARVVETGSAAHGETVAA